MSIRITDGETKGTQEQELAVSLEMLQERVLPQVSRRMLKVMDEAVYASTYQKGGCHGHIEFSVDCCMSTPVSFRQDRDKGGEINESTKKRN